MISSEEFQLKLQSGQIDEALALVSRDLSLLHRGFAHKLDVTTRTTQDPEREYLRTKIDLLTGEIQNEVSQAVIVDRAIYTQLQQLHIDQIVTSHRVVRGHLDRVKAILTALLSITNNAPPSAVAPTCLQEEDLVSSSLAESLTQSFQTAANGSSVVAARELDTDANQQLSQSTAASVSADKLERNTVGVDTSLDLAIDEDGELWEEWVEEDDVKAESSAEPSHISIPALDLPDLTLNWVRRPLDPLNVKPSVPRQYSTPLDPAERWEKFAPEYIDLDPNQNGDRRP